ncbi:MAG: hypothetical protein ACK542_07910, partial [Burkholderiales bacterium]
FSLELALNTKRKPEEVKSAEQIIANHLKEKGISINPNEIIFSKFPDPKLIDQVDAQLTKEGKNIYTFKINQHPLEKEITFSTNISLDQKEKEAIKELINNLHSGNKNPTSQDLFAAINGISPLLGYMRGGKITPNDSKIEYSIKSENGTLSLNLRTRNGLPPGPGTVNHLQGKLDSIEAKTDPIERNREIKILQKELFKYMNTLGDGKKENLIGADVLDHSLNAQTKSIDPEKSKPKENTAVISFATNPEDPKKLIYKIETAVEIIYFQANNKLTNRNLTEIADKAVNSSLPKASISGYFNKKGIQAKVIERTPDVEELNYKIPTTFNLDQKNQENNPNNPNPNPQQRVW